MIPNIVHLNPIAFTAAAVTGGDLRSIDLLGRAPFPVNVGISFRIQANGVAAGASKTATVSYALSPSPGRTIAQLGNAMSQQVLNLPNGAAAYSENTLPAILPTQRYLYLWFDHDELNADAGFTVTPVINC